MNWILLATPIAGILMIIVGVLVLRRAMPLNYDAPSKSDEVAEAVSRTAETFGRVIGAAIRDERQRGFDAGIETGMEYGTANHLEQVLSSTRAGMRA